MKNSLALGGVVGPAAFIAAWAGLGSRRPGYSPIEQPISELARMGMDSQTAMSAGFLAFAVGIGAYGVPARSKLAAAAAIASASVAAAPLGSRQEDLHFVAAASTYALLSALPLQAAVRARGWRRVVHLGVGAAAAATLAYSAMAPSHRGLLQRSGLTIVDVWLAANALVLLRRKNG